ncbi:MAG: chemotaxis protein CheW, partial [Gemmataceae bacterium]|nr:chemotaxis protein CheW [Gemmataceae bacterium]
MRRGSVLRRALDRIAASQRRIKGIVPCGALRACPQVSTRPPARNRPPRRAARARRSALRGLTPPARPDAKHRTPNTKHLPYPDPSMLALTFQIGDNRLALDIRRVREVVPRVELRRAPSAPAWLAGEFVYRG